MDEAVVECWNAERSRRHASSQHVLEVSPAEWEWFHYHDRQRRYCNDILKNRRSTWEDRQWATAEVSRHNG